MNTHETRQAIFEALDLRSDMSGVCVEEWVDAPRGSEIESIDPATGQVLASVRTGTRDDYEAAVAAARDSFQRWRTMPAPTRGELVRQLGNALRDKKQPLGQLVTLEMGKIISEGLGEVQEMIDMCDFATGLSRQLYGLTMASERPAHRMYEQWQPLGPTAIITAFNFPVAVWAWNSAVATVCGNSSLWKPSPLTPLTAIAVQNICLPILKSFQVPGLFTVCLCDGIEPGGWMAADRRLPLVSATGSCAMGRSVAAQVGARLGRSLLELGGNNAIIVTEQADLDLALRAVLFAAVGTAGQRCTTLRRLIVHRSVANQLLSKLVEAYQSVRVGDPADPTTLMGPLVTEAAVQQMLQALDAAGQQGGSVLTGGRRIDRPGFFVEPSIVRASSEMPIVSKETFAPVLYAIEYDSLEEAIEIHNAVDQGLSSAIFTDSVREAETFLSPAGSDCGIANVNIGTSGAEIGGAFGGEKDTGGGREAGSDAWKAYMRRQTCTINYGKDLPLAQGVEFEV